MHIVKSNGCPPQGWRRKVWSSSTSITIELGNNTLVCILILPHAGLNSQVGAGSAYPWMSLSYSPSRRLPKFHSFPKPKHSYPPSSSSSGPVSFKFRFRVNPDDELDLSISVSSWLGGGRLTLGRVANNRACRAGDCGLSVAAAGPHDASILARHRAIVVILLLLWIRFPLPIVIIICRPADVCKSCWPELREIWAAIIMLLNSGY